MGKYTPASIVAIVIGCVCLLVAIIYGIVAGGQEDFLNKPIGHPVGRSNGGVYDGIDFSKDDENSRKEAMDIPFKTVRLANGDELGSIDPYAFNHYSHECCPGPLSSSTGCICLSKVQRDFLRGRGGNHTLL